MNVTEKEGVNLSRESRRLSREISAIQILPLRGDRGKMGTIISIPEGAEIEMCGIGFNDRTARICWHGDYYFGFREDFAFEPRKQARAQAAGAE